MSIEDTELDALIEDLHASQRLRGKLIQGATLQRAYDEWSSAGMPIDGPHDAHLECVFQHGMMYAFKLLGADYLGAENWVASDGSESVEGDALGTIGNIFAAAGLVNHDDEPLAGDELRALLPDPSNVVRLGQHGAQPSTIEQRHAPGSDPSRLMTQIRNVVRQAWNVCDDTAEQGDDKDYLVDRESWRALSEALDKLEALIPDSQQPAQAGHAVTLAMQALNVEGADGEQVEPATGSTFIRKQLEWVGSKGRTVDTDFVDSGLGYEIRGLIHQGLVSRTKLNPRQTLLRLTRKGLSSLEESANG